MRPPSITYVRLCNYAVLGNLRLDQWEILNIVIVVLVVIEGLHDEGRRLGIPSPGTGDYRADGLEVTRRLTYYHPWGVGGERTSGTEGGDGGGKEEEPHLIFDSVFG